MGALGGQTPGGEDQLARRARAENAQEALDAARVVAESEPGRRHREEGIVGRDPQIATRGQRGARAHARSDDDGDGRPRDGLDQLAGVLDQVVVSARIGGAAARGLKIGDIRAGRERRVAVAADHHDAHVFVRTHVGGKSSDRTPHRAGDGVAPGRVAQPQRGNAAGHVDCDIAAFAHRVMPACGRANDPPPRPKTARRGPHSPPPAPRY